MKKQFIYPVYMVLTLAALWLSGCKKDYLERTPSDYISEEEVFRNIENAQAFLNNAYNALPDWLYPSDGGNYNIGAGTDEMVHQWFHARTARDFNSGNWNPANFPLQNVYTDCYSAIRRINIFLKNFDLIPEEVGTGVGNRKNRLKGEAYGLRAFYYFELFKMWGGVPLLDHALSPAGENIYLPRNTEEEVISFIKKDIEEAIALLPAKHDDSQLGRFTATAAKALLSKVTLYYASSLWNPGNDAARWEAAAIAAKDAISYAEKNGYIISLGEVGQKKAYERIFLELNNPEVLFCKNTYMSSYWDFYASSLGCGGWYGDSPLQEMVDDYETATGLSIKDPAAHYNNQDPYINRDPRFYQSILFHGAQWQGRKINVAPGGLDRDMDRQRTNYFVRKYIQEGHNLFTDVGSIYRRFSIYRLGELYLNYAEAWNERYGPDNTVYDAVNKLRNRAGMPDLPGGLSKEIMRERIRHERRIELAFEGHRFWDVRRWKIAEQVDNGEVHGVNVSTAGVFTYPVYETRVFDKKKHYVFPIPQSELDKNQNMKQNPGWE
ncbi:RagB/SusD family nutrient uptake outer membrane protein [Chitinophaga defluvii]|uniref:RagB/SusD family nutrient uptake outer membrane protein n=1 Tax=Chitinophaga defluvii TaxID=3163343 RepID=A0ABV2TBL0_9BACT